MNRSRFWCTLAMLTLLSACGGNQPWEDPAPANPLVESFEASPEEVFSVLPDVLRRLRLGPATRLDTERLLIETTRDIEFSRSLAGPPEAPIVRCQVMAELSRDDSFTWLRQGQVSGPGTATIRLRVEPADGGAIVHITMIASSGSGAFVASAASDALGAVAHSCYSTGVVESRIAEAVRAAVDPDYDPPEPTERRPF